MKLPNYFLDDCCKKKPGVEWDGGEITAKCRKCGDLVTNREMWKLMIAWNKKKRGLK